MGFGPPGRLKLQYHYQCVFFFATEEKRKRVSTYFFFQLVTKIFSESPPVNHQQAEGDAVTDLLWVTVCERQFSCDMEHDFSSVKGRNDCLTSCLTITHIESSSEPEKRAWGDRLMWFYTLHASAKHHQHAALYPVKPCRWTVSPKMERNSLNSSLSSLLLSMSSSVN